MMVNRRDVGLVLGIGLLALATGCSGDSGGVPTQLAAQSCMLCHNASLQNDYAGPGIENPHPFPGASTILCTTCHGGNPNGSDKVSSHVPPPPEIGDTQNLIDDRHAYFNRLTLVGIDKFPNYTVGSVTYTALDYLQFVNPGDLRVVTKGRSCGQCHQDHSDIVGGSLLATEAGILSGAPYAIGELHALGNTNFEDTAADKGFRAVVDDDAPPVGQGAVSQLLEYPLFSKLGGTGSPDDIHGHDTLYDAETMFNYQQADGRVVPGSPLSNVYHEQVAFTCGDCHLGSAGANNRAGDFRSSGCTACHMQYSLGGRSGSMDPNVNKVEPLDPDDIDEPERAHVRTHRIASVSKTLPGGVQVQGIDDYACAGCHQGSNRTVMQYWGIRLDQNEDVFNGVQYPTNPASFLTTNNDQRLFPDEVNNNTFNGRRHRQYLKFEDYDNDSRDDTPADVHYEAGMGCIDCHGSHDLHGGDVAGGDVEVLSRMEQAVAIRCENCHGTASTYAATVSGTTYSGQAATVGVDSEGLPLRHVVKEGNDLFLYSRLDGVKHYIPQTRDVVVDSGKTNPFDGQPLYSAKASFAMGRDDGSPTTGIGPQQSGPPLGFSHSDSMDCASCHSSWTNTCMGCHLVGEYNTNNNFSNITGDNIVFREKNADFVYQSPLFFQLGVGVDNRIKTFSSNTKMFFTWEDRQNDRSDVFAFSDRNAAGNNAATPSAALSHNALMAHSIRGKVDSQNEGPRYCVACHLTDTAISVYGTQYDQFRTAMATGNYAALNYPLLQQHFGTNTGNQMNSPLFVHMVAGLGSGLFLFDQNGGPVNDLDTNTNRVGTFPNSPKQNFPTAVPVYNLDRVVEADGTSNASSNHAMTNPGEGDPLRDGAADPNMAGPLGADLIRRLTDPDTGIVLDSWIDANGAAQGGAGPILGTP